MSRKPETAVQTRFGDLLFDRMEEWRRAQKRIPPLADTVRQLVKRGLNAEEIERDLEAVKADTTSGENRIFPSVKPKDAGNGNARDQAGDTST
jgi:hypothetical protein